MWKQKLCLGIGPQFGLSMQEIMEMVQKAGFDAVFTQWRKGDASLQWAKQAADMGLIYQSIHAPWGRSADMWHGTEEKALAGVEELTDCLRTCADAQVPIMVAHAFVGFNDHNPTQAGIDCFGQVVAEAEKLGVKIAFENTEGEEYLAALMHAFAGSKFTGFCWDTGHEMCYNHSQDLLALYGDQLICTHINDNLGIRDFHGEITFIDDLHLLPFDGIADWCSIAARLDGCGYRDIMTFELSTRSKPGRHENDCYARMPVPEYIAEAYKRACRVAALRRLNMIGE